MIIKSKIFKYWSDIAIALFFVCGIILFAVMGEDSYIAIHDNLDLFQPQFQMMKDSGTFFAHNAPIGFLHGISRDVCASEWSLTTFLYIIFPSLTAYILNYFLKTLIGWLSGRLLAYELLGDKADQYHTIINLCAFGYGLINFFPCFGIPFTSIPLVVYLLIKIERADRTWPWYIALFAYPFVSYFSYLGFFILAYMVVALVWISIVRKKFDVRMFIALIVLAAGYVCFEYRLFAMMLLSDEATIRETMVLSDFTFGEAMREAVDVFVNNSFHADALTGKLVMPICVAYFVVNNIYLVIKRKAKEIFHSPYNLIMLIIVFNSLMYGLYTLSAVRDLVESIVPQLSGFQFDRTSFFNPLLWSCALFIICMKLYDCACVGQKISGICLKTLSMGLGVVYILIILVTPTRYNDLRATGVNAIKTKIYNNTIDDMNYREFYGEEVFAKAKESIGYDGEWSVAYGFYPAVLEYNGIDTLDGYLGFYSQQYKEDFRKIIAPAIDRVEASRLYYDNWGARAYLYSGTQAAIVSPTKSFAPDDTALFIDIDAFKALDGKYIFSRYELDGGVSGDLDYLGCYEASGIPYSCYVYAAR